MNSRRIEDISVRETRNKKQILDKNLEVNGVWKTYIYCDGRIILKWTLK
jgi:hypothetical protein